MLVLLRASQRGARGSPQPARLLLLVGGGILLGGLICWLLAVGGRRSASCELNLEAGS